MPVGRKIARFVAKTAVADSLLDRRMHETTGRNEAVPCTSRIWRHEGRLASEDFRLSPRVYLQPSCFRFVQHPLQRNFRQLTLRLRIAAPNIGMHARKPNLLYVLAGVVGRAKQVLPEEGSPFVDRHRVTNDV
jgi:hypothetical protein